MNECASEVGITTRKIARADINCELMTWQWEELGDGSASEFRENECTVPSTPPRDHPGRKGTTTLEPNIGGSDEAKQEEWARLANNALRWLRESGEYIYDETATFTIAASHILGEAIQGGWSELLHKLGGKPAERKGKAAGSENGEFVTTGGNRASKGKRKRESESEGAKTEQHLSKLASLEALLISGIHPKTGEAMTDAQIRKVQSVIDLLKARLRLQRGGEDEDEDEQDKSMLERDDGADGADGADVTDDEEYHETKERERMARAKVIAARCAGKEPDWCAEEADMCGDPKEKVEKLCPCTCGIDIDAGSMQCKAGGGTC
jgi:hypothetical protein